MQYGSAFRRGECLARAGDLELRANDAAESLRSVHRWRIVWERVATPNGDLVLDNLTEVIRPWQSTDYHWLKIQSAKDARFWYDIKVPGAFLSQADRKQRLAQRQ